MKNVVVLAFDGAQALDITGPMEVFSKGNSFADTPAYRLVCLGAPQSNVQVSNGLILATKHFASWRGEIDTIIVPGGSEEALLALRSEAKFIRWLTTQLRKAKRIVSVCTGAFVLAELGFLDGRKASTHWNACEQLQTFYPKVEVVPDAIYTKDGNVYTSAGVTTGIDLALSLIEEDLGKEASLAIARSLVLYLRRSGGQSQFSVPLALQLSDEGRIEKILSYIKRNPQADLSINAMADKFFITPRHLSRLFSEGVGLSPAKHVTKMRLYTAKEFLETSKLGISQIAVKSGFASQSTMSKTFRKHFGVTPSDYRARFS